LIIQDEVTRINLGRLVTTVLRKIFPSNDYKKLLDNVTKAIDLRNDIIHESEIDVLEEKAKKAIQDVGMYMEFIHRKLIDFLNQSSIKPD
jgi:hypothetical protein